MCANYLGLVPLVCLDLALPGLRLHPVNGDTSSLKITFMRMPLVACIYFLDFICAHVLYFYL